ncbi:abortive infection protein [Paenibacillus oryzae]|uniref:Abortive infection protein n=1 Tax=Paenibacillus oryzae TaxID=1844972 RepID=A0A1A5YS10_9BACL|nr:ATP-binding protein [Paenibacillus oryzae]OBR68407.1 abortive infection protein [Paenibacillus oryzae]
MLIDYTFSNFRSFEKEAGISMRASSQRTLGTNLLHARGQRLLPSAVIYGPNASGKSSIIMSLEIMREMVLAGSLDADGEGLNYLELYPFAHGNSRRPMLFQIEFINQGFHIRYSIEVECEPLKRSSRRIYSEQLSVINKKGELISLFERTKDKIVIAEDQRALELLGLQKDLLKKLEELVNFNHDKMDLFLARTFKNLIKTEIAEAVIDFFRNKLTVVSDFSLKKSKFSFHMKDMPDQNTMLWNKTLETFIKRADFGPQHILFESNPQDDEETTDMELYSLYQINGRDVAIPAELMESRGTMKLLDFAIPFEQHFTSGGVFVLDEFDSAIHPELVKGILSLYNNPNINKQGAQLIFTTHNPIYLNNQIFRRDQIRFVEKDRESYGSAVYSLADFGSESVRNDHNYLINYFKGNYGALPFIDFSGLLEDVSNEGGE